MHRPIFEKEYARIWRIERNEELLILAGTTLVNEESKASIFELNNKAQITWNKIYGDELKHGMSKIAVSSGICLGGSTPDEDFWIAKVDLNGEFLWNGTFGTPTRERVGGIAATTEGDCILAGRSGYISDNVLLGNFASLDGEVKWAKINNFSPDDQTEGMITTLDQGFIVFGDHYVDSLNWNGMVIKLDKDGNVVWARSYSFETENHHEKMQGAVELRDRNLIFISVFHPPVYWEFRIFKTDPDGVLIWNETIPQDTHKYNSKNIIELCDHNIFVMGLYYPISDANNKRIFFALFSPDSGELIGLYHHIRETTSEYYQSLTRTSDCGFALASYGKDSKTWVLKDYPYNYFEYYQFT